MKIIKKQIHGKESRDKMMQGVNELADVVGSTMGAKGRNVIIDNEHGAPLVVNDGVTIANEVFFEDNLKNQSAQLVKDAARRTNALAGDGTTGSIVLSRAILKAGWDLVEKGANPVLLKKELDAAVENIIDNLKKQGSEIKKKEQAIQIASVSVQDKKLGKLIGGLVFDIGKDGAVEIKHSVKTGVTIEKDAGMKLQGALTEGVLENGNKWETKLEDAHVLILKNSPEDHEFESKWLPFMRTLTDAEEVIDSDGKKKIAVKKVHTPQLIIVAEKLSKRFIKNMNLNLNMFKWVWFRPTTADKNMPEIYKDLQSIIGGKIVDEEKGVYLSKMTPADLGKAESATVGRHDAIFTVGEERLKSDPYLDRCNVVKEQTQNAEDEIEKLQIEERYSNLTGGVAAIKVLAATQQETTELRLRIEDAINATKAAMEEGYVAGGGVALLNAVKANKTDGEKVLKQACEASVRQIFHNAGYDNIDEIIKRLKEGEGVNVLTDETINMKNEGIVDPLKVIKLSLIHAVSVAGLLLTSEYVITNEEDDNAAVKRFFTQKN